MLSAKELVREISAKSGRAEPDVRKMIKSKQVELSGLVSEEGAAYIVGRELGVDLMKDARRELKIKNIVPDMRSVEITAKVLSVFEPREFDKNGKKGKVASIILGDETGTTRLPFWNEEVKLISSIGIAEGDAIEISGAWAKADQKGGVELRLGRRGKIRKLDEDPGIEVDVRESKEPGGGISAPVPAAAQRTTIRMLKAGMNAAVKACIVQVYKKRPYYEVCPSCGKRLEDSSGKLVCKEHGEVEPACSLLLSGVIDDGTGNIRCVFFREQAERIFGRSCDEIRQEFDRNGLDDFWQKFDGLGKEFLIEGRAKVNDFSKELEILAGRVAELDVKDESDRLLRTITS